KINLINYAYSMPILQLVDLLVIVENETALERINFNILNYFQHIETGFFIFASFFYQPYRGDMLNIIYTALAGVVDKWMVLNLIFNRRGDSLSAFIFGLFTITLLPYRFSGPLKTFSCI
ncbi:MAG: hypothetical protein JW927_22170, partial [Deltaproteobacteria bacterium]|nr:hypothetical protein [Deltaproteobacteria bacterium]